MRAARALWFVIILCLAAGWVFPQTTAPAAAQAPQPGLPACQWGYYPGGKGAWVALFSDPEATTPSALRLGTQLSSKGSTRSSRGGIDFNGDGKSDIYRMGADAQQNLAWQYASSAAAPGPVAWNTLAPGLTYIDPTSIWFGDFNGDGKTDIFFRVSAAGSGYSWYYNSAGGNNSTFLYTYAGPNPIPIGVGDFNGDGKSDIFSFIPNSPYAGMYRWQYYPGGTYPPVSIAYAVNNPSDLRFGDFDGDGITDVFAATEAGNGQYQWMYSSGGNQNYQNLALTTYPVGQLNLGDLDGDGITDVFVRVAPQNSSPRWQYWPGGKGSPITLRTTSDPMPYLADLNNDGAADAFLARCAPKPRFTERQSIPQNALDPTVTYNAYALDLNGDKADDVLFASGCQDDYGFCDGRKIIAAGLLAKPGTLSFSVLPNQVLDPGDWTRARDFPGDFDRNGRGDLIINQITDTFNLTRVIGWAPGGFTISTLVSLGGMPGYYNTAGGDYNGDGRTDLLWSSNCIDSGAGCGGWQRKNTVMAALSTGGNLLLTSPQNFTDFSEPSFRGRVLDVNGDGRDDLLWFKGSTDSKTFYVALANGGGDFTMLPQQSFGLGWASYIDPAVGDFNGDGREDLALLHSCFAFDCQRWHGLRILFGQANGQLLASGGFMLGARDWQNFKLHVADVNGDGKDDLLWTGGGATDYVSTGFMTVAYSNGDGTFTASGLEQAAETFNYSPRALAGDFNGDGRPDVLWTTSSAYKLLINGAAFRGFLPVMQK